MRNHNDERIKVIWFERADGYIYVPADSSRSTPDGFIRREATTLKEIDALTARLNRQDKRQFDQMFEQDYLTMKQSHDRKRTTLQRRMLAADCGPGERLFIQSALRYFDRKEEEALKYTVRGYFHQREFDSKNAKIDDYGKQLSMPKMSARLASELGIRQD